MTALAPVPFATLDEPARQVLLTQHLGLVRHVARQVAGRGQDDVELDELVSAGTMGLIQALAAFEPARGHSFSTFAVPRIRGAILDELRRMDRVPRSVRRKSRDVARARAELEREHGRAPTSSELAVRLGVSTDVLRRWEYDVESGTHLSLDQALREDAGRELAPSELLAGSGSPMSRSDSRSSRRRWGCMRPCRS